MGTLLLVPSSFKAPDTVPPGWAAAVNVKHGTECGLMASSRGARGTCPRAPEERELIQHKLVLHKVLCSRDPGVVGDGQLCQLSTSSLGDRTREQMRQAVTHPHCPLKKGHGGNVAANGL